MKKYFYVALMGFGLTSVFAQESDRKVEYGVKAGYASSSLTMKELDYVKPGHRFSGYSFGVFAEIPFAEDFSFQPELEYSKTGGKYEGKSPWQEGGYSKTSRNNLSIPLMVKYYFYDGLNVQFGPQVDFLTSANLKSKWKTWDTPSSYKFVEKDTSYSNIMNKVSFGAVVGLGYKLPVGVSFDARFNYGLNNIYNSKKAKEAGEGGLDLKSRVLSFSVGYQF